MRWSSLLGLAAGVAFALVGVAPASAGTVTLGTATGALAVHFNASTGAGENGNTNVSYVQAVFGASNDNGAEFLFDKSSLPTTYTPGQAFAGEGNWYEKFAANISSYPATQFGLDLIWEATTNVSTVPTLTVYDNTDGTVAGRAAAGTAAWAINDYKGGSPSGPGTASNQVINSLIRGDGVTITSQTLTATASGFALDIAGTLQSDGLFHWFNPSFGSSSAVIDANLTGRYFFSGTMYYDQSKDTTDLLDFYSGTIQIDAEVVPLPSAAWMGLGMLGLLGLTVGLRRRRLAL
jgi:hypothetical protein